MIGQTLKHIREKKGFSARAIAQKTITPTQLSRIENRGQIPGVDSFIKLLYSLNVSFEEFCLLTEDSHAKARVKTKSNTANVLRKRNSREMKETIKELEAYYNEFDDAYFIHISCIVKAKLALSESNYDYSVTLDILKPVSDYLLFVETWFEYEISLFINCIYLFPLEKAITLGDNALDKIKKNYILLKNEELTRSLLVNLATYALSEKKYHSHAHDYITKALSLPQSTHILYNSLLAKIIYQATCYKLGNGDYDEAYLTDLLLGLKLMKFDDAYNEFVNFLSQHDIVIEKLHPL